MSLRNRFFKNLRPASNGCIEWVAHRNRDGYGRLGIDKKLKLAHHVSWFLKYGVWPKQLNHHCDNPACVRPSHLYEGNAKQNQADCIARKRKPRGEACTFSKLTQAQVDDIRRLHTTRMSLEEIAEQFGVTPIYVNAIAHRRVWDDGERPTRKPWSCTQIDIDGHLLSIQEVALMTGLTGAAIRARMNRGLTGQDLVAGKHRAKRKSYTPRQ